MFWYLGDYMPFSINKIGDTHLAQSMTAFARREEQTPVGKIALEIRSVNNRFLDPVFRLPEAFRLLEPEMRKRLETSVKRGRVEINVRLDRSSASEDNAQINLQQLQVLAKLQNAVLDTMPNANVMSVSSVLQWPGIVEKSDTDDDQTAAVFFPLFDGVVEDFIISRKQEGARLGDLISKRIQSSRLLVAELQENLPIIRQHMRQRLEQRLVEIVDRVDAERVEQEMVILLNKADVDEEIDRLNIHFDAVEDVLKNDAAIGRKLDFLMQELNREANTLGSKSAHPDMTNASMELKVLIEQMREQVQNLE